MTKPCAIHDEAFKSLQKDITFIKDSQFEMKVEQKKFQAETRLDLKELLQHKSRMMGIVATIAIVASGIFSIIASAITSLVKGQ